VKVQSGMDVLEVEGQFRVVALDNDLCASLHGLCPDATHLGSGELMAWDS
jgi:hypothetical protein